MLRWMNIRQFIQHSVRHSRSKSSAPTVALNDKHEEFTNGSNTIHTNNIRKNNKSKLVATVFEHLKKSTSSENTVDKRIRDAKTPNELLSLSDKHILTKSQTLQIVSMLSDWSINGKVDMNEFESDVRFITMCRYLGRNKAAKLKKEVSKPPSEDETAMVMNIKQSDEAAKLVSEITTPQMISVLHQLAVKKKRSTPLLRSLAFNLTRSMEMFNVKQSSDILFSLASLHFIDEPLIAKVCSDLRLAIPKCNKAAVIGSIATSLRILRYKDDGLLDVISSWIIKHERVSRFQDLVSFLQTMATVNYIPENDQIFEVILQNVTKENCSNILTWLDIVWSLTMLGKSSSEHFDSVLNNQFLDLISKNETGNLSTYVNMKLLNINGATKSYNINKDELLKSVNIENINITRSKEKQLLVTNVLDTLTNLLPSEKYIKRNIDTGMGFFIDAECVFDHKMIPLLVDDESEKSKIRVAVMVWDYHDFTRGKVELCGLANLMKKLTENMGYKILSVPFMEFNLQDKVIPRVQFLQKELKNLIEETSFTDSS